MGVHFTLKEILNKRGISEYRLSRETGIRPNTIGDICRNEIQRLNVKYIDDICRVLQIEPGEWIKREN